MTKQTNIKAGYRAFNGHVFTAREAEIYNAACKRAENESTESALNSQHLTFSVLIGIA